MLVQRIQYIILIFIQFIHGTWVDDLSKTSQNKKLSNVYISYADFLAFDLFPLLGDSETFVVLWTNKNFKDMYLCCRLISSTAVKHLSDVKAILI